MCETGRVSMNGHVRRSIDQGMCIYVVEARDTRVSWEFPSMVYKVVDVPHSVMLGAVSSHRVVLYIPVEAWQVGN